MIDVLVACAKKKTKFIFLGDHHQLPPIGLGGDEDSPTFSIKSHYRLTEKIRQVKGDYIAELCDYVCERIDTDNDIEFLHVIKGKFNNKTNKGYAVSTKQNVIKSFVKNFNEGVDVRITAYRNSRIDSLNSEIRAILWGVECKNKFVPGEFIVLNDQYAPNGFPLAYNGQTFKVKKVMTETVDFVDCYVLSVGDNLHLPVPTESGYKVYKSHLDHLKGVAIQTRDWGEYQSFKFQFANVSYGYAINNYKIQGSTIKGCYVDVSDILSVKPISDKRKLQALYVGISRPTHFLGLF
jgi:hypothetical protein